jgi:hypothetical protein
MVARRKIADQKTGFLFGNFGAPVFHLVDGRFPSRNRHPLLRNEICAMANGTTSENQSSARRLSATLIEPVSSAGTAVSAESATPLIANKIPRALDVFIMR